MSSRYSWWELTIFRGVCGINRTFRSSLHFLGCTYYIQHRILYTSNLFLHLVLLPSDLLKVFYLLKDLAFEILQVLIHCLENMRYPSSEDPNSK